jgi:hypothetical protein
VRDARRLKLLSDERFSVNGKPFPLKAIG